MSLLVLLECDDKDSDIGFTLNVFDNFMLYILIIFNVNVSANHFNWVIL